MKRIAARLLLALTLCLGAGSPTLSQEAPEIRFVPARLVIDAGDAPLAAFQVEVITETGRVELVGLEGNGALPFQNPPYYDPQALQRDEVVVAGFSTAAAAGLPTGRVRVATLHLQVTGPAPKFRVALRAAAAPDGRRLAASATLEVGTE